MGWFKKEEPTPFDEMPLAGLFFLDGDLLARLVGRDWTVGEKLPMIAFPSGEEFQLWEGGIVHIFGEMDLLLKDTRDEAYSHASHIGEQCGYVVRPVGENHAGGSFGGFLSCCGQHGVYALVVVADGFEGDVTRRREGIAAVFYGFFIGVRGGDSPDGLAFKVAHGGVSPEGGIMMAEIGTPAQEMPG